MSNENQKLLAGEGGFVPYSFTPPHSKSQEIAESPQMLVEIPHVGT